MGGLDKGNRQTGSSERDICLCLFCSPRLVPVLGNSHSCLSSGSGNDMSLLQHKLWPTFSGDGNGA